MKRKICLALVVTLMLGTGVKVKAQELSESRLAVIGEPFISELAETPELMAGKYDNVLSVQEVEVPEELKECVVAVETDSLGNQTTVECEVTLVQIEMANKTTEFSEQGQSDRETVYILTGTTKQSQDGKTENGVQLNGTICWVDNLGSSNELKYVSGSRGGSCSGTGRYFFGGRGTGYDGIFEDSFTDNSQNGEVSRWFVLRAYSYPLSGGSEICLEIKTSVLD